MAVDALVVEDGQVTLSSGCAATEIRLKATRHGTRLKAKWGSCVGLRGRVKLRALIGPGCDTVAGKFKAKHFKRSFMGDRVPNICGDGSMDGAEACDDANAASCDGCAGDCLRLDGLCGDGLVECGEACDGVGSCPEGQSCDGTSCTCQPDIPDVCAEATMCGDLHYCSAEQDCLCIRSAEGPIQCGRIPSTCDVPLCETSADCAALGPGYFCDTPNSGCCTDPPGELPRCIAPCTSPPCPPAQVCGAGCCSDGFSCIDGACCSSDHVCGATCCAADEICTDGTCTPVGPCDGDPVTVESLAAARAALEGGALSVDVSAGGCIRYLRTLEGDQLTSDAVVVAGETTAEYAYTAAGASGRQDVDHDGFFESDAALTLGTDPEIALELRRFDPGSGEVTRREQRLGTGDTVHVLVEEYGVVVNQFDTPAEQATGASEAVAATFTDCGVDGHARYLAQMLRCLARTPMCLEQHGRKDVAREMLRMGLKVTIRCGADLGDAYANANAREAGLGRTPRITVNPAKMDGASDGVVASTMCHELMHFGSLGLHDPALDNHPRRGEMDPVRACEELCGFSGLGDGPTKCHCATCLETVECDERCKPYKVCDAQMGAICPCPPRHIWYPTYSECKAECPSGLACFGYRDCINLDRSCS